MPGTRLDGRHAVPPLADVQRRIRDAVVTGECESVAPLLVGGRNPARRLAIHRHHYEASLATALVGRFPATEWLVGSIRLQEAARHFVLRHPPTAPCMAEYGRNFPAFLATWPGTAHLSYLREFADLDWHLGRLAVSTDAPALTPERLATVDPGDLADAIVTMQTGTHYLSAGWPIDELITMYLTDAAPVSWTLVDHEVRIEVRGARGAFRLSRLSAADYAFRVAISAGYSLGNAAARAFEIDSAFDPGLALAALVRDELVTSIDRPPIGAPS